MFCVNQNGKIGFTKMTSYSLVSIFVPRIKRLFRHHLCLEDDQIPGMCQYLSSQSCLFTKFYVISDLTTFARMFKIKATLEMSVFPITN